MRGKALGCHLRAGALVRGRHTEAVPFVTVEPALDASKCLLMGSFAVVYTCCSFGFTLPQTVFSSVN